MANQNVLVKIATITSFILIFGFLWIPWTFLVHEPSHYFACELMGYDGRIHMDVGWQPAMECTNMHGATYPSLFFLKIAPYVVDILILSLFVLSAPKKFILKLIPCTAFLDIVVYNFLLHLLGQQENDYTAVLLQIKPLYRYAVMIPLAAIVIFYFVYLKEVKKVWVNVEDFWWKKLKTGQHSD
jgi:hypothetical protein